jgi:hypothetical protein
MTEKKERKEENKISKSCTKGPLLFVQNVEMFKGQVES